MKTWITIATLVFAAQACRPKAKPAHQTATQVEDATASRPDVAGVAEAPNPAADAVLEPAGACAADFDCEGYFRCENGACVVPPAVDGRVVEGMPTAKFIKDGKDVAEFYLEVADEHEERMRGLMFRRKMDPGFGMIFIFDGDEQRSFWMKNTLIPLDMVHIDSKGTVVGVVAKAEPMTLSPRSTGKPARYVLELTSGRAEEVGIEAGMTMVLTGLPAEQSPAP